MTAMESIRVLVADDGALVRAGFRSLLQTFQHVEVVAEAGDGAEALELIVRHHPQVVLMDISMPRLNGLEALERISREFPDVRVIIVSMHTSEEFVVHALRAGAAGYVTKNSSPAELELAVRAAARGDTYLSPVVAKFVLGDYAKRIGPTSPLERLTPRQREILQLIAEGHSSKEIAKTLELSVNTVEAHRTQLMNALDIHDVAGLVRFAIRTGLTSVDR
jgi:DNA-binding NarL/FixJ family response regulator